MEQSKFNSTPEEMRKEPLAPETAEVRTAEIAEAAPVTREETVERPKDFTEFVEEEEGVLRALGKQVRGRLSQAALAVSMLAGASTEYARAEEPGAAPKESPAIVTQESFEASAKKASMIEQMFSRVEFSAGGRREVIGPGTVEEIFRGNFSHTVSTDFYKGFTREEYDNAYKDYVRSVMDSSNVTEFYEKLHGLKFTMRQKMMALQTLGISLNGMYDQDMMNKNEHVKISEEAQFEALAGSYHLKPGKVGICGNIHTFMAHVAHEMGLEAWLQTTSKEGAGHVIMGVVTNAGQGEEIAFLDYGRLIRTGTLNYRDALGIAERADRGIAFLGSAFAAPGGQGIKVKSRAQEVAEGFAGIHDAERVLEENLGAGAIIRDLNGMQIGLGREINTLKLSSDHVAVSFANFQNVDQNPYQSLKSLSATSAGVKGGGEHFGGEAEVTYMHFNVQDLENRNIDFSAIVPRVFGSYLNSLDLTKGEYGKLSANLGATLQAALRIPLDRKMELSGAGATAEAAVGGRVIYIDPKEAGKFYVGASALARTELGDFEAQRMAAPVEAMQLRVGGEVSVQKGMVLNFDAVRSKYQWGSGVSANVGLRDANNRFDVSYKQDTSKTERILPSSKNIEMSVSHKFNPQWEIRVTGFKSSEQYRGAAPRDQMGGMVTVVLRGF